VHKAVSNVLLRVVPQQVQSIWERGVLLTAVNPYCSLEGEVEARKLVLLWQSKYKFKPQLAYIQILRMFSFSSIKRKDGLGTIPSADRV
jgi:hypothetical protein